LDCLHGKIKLCPSQKPNMETEKGVILIVYKEVRRSQRYAVLKRKKNWEGWELPKGHLEEDDYRETAKIELNEECRISEDQIKDITDIEETVEWKYKQEGKEFKKEYKAFIVKVDEETLIDTNQNPCDEHSQGFFLKKDDAEGLLTYENNKDILEKASKEIENN